MPQSQMSTEERISANARNGGSTPPWGDEENFDADRAWTLIQNLRAEKEDLRVRFTADLEERDRRIAEKEQEISQTASSISDFQDKISSLEKDLETRTTELGNARGDLGARDAMITKQRLLNEAGIPLDYVDNVTGDDEEAWTASVERLQSLAQTSGSQGAPDPVQAARNGGAQLGPSKDEEANQLFFGN